MTRVSVSDWQLCITRVERFGSGLGGTSLYLHEDVHAVEADEQVLASGDERDVAVGILA